MADYDAPTLRALYAMIFKLVEQGDAAAKQGERHTALLAEIRDALRAEAADRRHRGG